MKDLTPEERAIGKQNFDEATGSTRREFLTTIGIVGGTAAAVGLGAKYFKYGPKLDDRLRVGIIGTGDEGNVLIGALNPDYVDAVAIADIRPYSIHRAFHGDGNRHHVRFSPSDRGLIDVQTDCRPRFWPALRRRADSLANGQPRKGHRLSRHCR